MSDSEITLFMLLCFIGGICIGLLIRDQQIRKWRIRWIQLEHNLARKENREPRNINKFDKEESKK